MTELYYPLRSLREGHWFKLICGASFQHLPAVRNLTLAYTLAGADCIDVAADPAVIASALDALKVASELGEEAQARGFGYKSRPWLMVSLNDGEDPHFRKAEFDPDLCPADCTRPCEKICPAQAIVFQKASEGFSGVVDKRCYGCGRCLPVCPNQLIYTRSYVSAPEAIAELILQDGVDALEIHTKVGNYSDFQRLWKAIAPWVDRLKLLAISCPDGEGLIDYLWTLYKLITPLPCPLVLQTDGRPMSGDIGTGATRAAVKLGQKVLAAGLPGYVQLAGGTNNHTVAKLQATGLLKRLQVEQELPVGRLQVEQGLQVGRLQASVSVSVRLSAHAEVRTVESSNLQQTNLPFGNAKRVQPSTNKPSNLPHNTKITDARINTDNSSLYPSSNPSGANLQQTNQTYIAGVGYGSYARVLLSPILDELENFNGQEADANLVPHQSPPIGHLEELPSRLWQAVEKAHSLVSQLKSSEKLPQPIPL